MKFTGLKWSPYGNSIVGTAIIYHLMNTQLIVDSLGNIVFFYKWGFMDVSMMPAISI